MRIGSRDIRSKSDQDSSLNTINTCIGSLDPKVTYHQWHAKTWQKDDRGHQIIHCKQDTLGESTIATGR